MSLALSQKIVLRTPPSKQSKGLSNASRSSSEFRFRDDLARFEPPLDLIQPFHDARDVGISLQRQVTNVGFEGFGRRLVQ